MIDLPPLESFLSEDWISGAFSSKVVDRAMSTVVASASGELFQFAELVTQGADLVTGAIERVQDIGADVIGLLQSGDAANIAGWAATLIKLFVRGLENAFAKSAANAKKNALQSQWDAATYLVLRRTAFAKNLPGGGNFNYEQPGWKKDWPQAAVPPVPRKFYQYEYEGKIHSAYRNVVLFEQTTPADVDFDQGCFSLGDGGCDAPPDSVIGLSFLTWPIMVEDYGIPWGGGQLIPFVATLTTPTMLHVQVRQATVDGLRSRMRAIMREVWNLKFGPPLAPDAVTVWPDGTYAAPTEDQQKYLEMNAKIVDPYYQKWLAGWNKDKETLEEYGQRVPWVRPRVRLRGAGPWIGQTPLNQDRYGETLEGALISPAWADIGSVSAAFRTLQRWQECRRACLRDFAKLPESVRAAAKKNPDFSEANIARWGGPNGGPIPQPPREREQGARTS